MKTDVLKNLAKNSQEAICARVSFLITLQGTACNFIKKETLAQVFRCEFCEIFFRTFFAEHFQVTAWVFSLVLLKMSQYKEKVTAISYIDRYSLDFCIFNIKTMTVVLKLICPNKLNKIYLQKTWNMKGAKQKCKCKINEILAR